MNIPHKPFPDYKWRWAELTPSEGLNHPVRLIGVLRAMYKHQGKSKSTPDIYIDLKKVEQDTNQLTGQKVKLARTGERNLFRNSDRYWKAVGLLESDSRNIKLTPLGNALAEGRITQREFAITVIKTLTLPNKNIETDTSEWERIGLKIKPFELILNIIASLLANFGETAAYITPFELQKIIIPLAGNQVPVEDYLKTIIDFRNGELDISQFPDCAPRSNDRRMSREFLLFLSHYGFCNLIKGKNNAEGKFYIQKKYLPEIQSIIKLKNSGIQLNQVIQNIRNDEIISNTERQKVLTKVLSRPQQAKFRRQVMSKFANTCVLTGEKMNVVLEACHIIPVEHKGNDVFSNGLCMRSDIHILFDSKHIRFQPSGIVEYSDAIKASVSYKKLPNIVNIPNFTSKEALEWRYNYY